MFYVFVNGYKRITIREETRALAVDETIRWAKGNNIPLNMVKIVKV